MKKVLVVDDAIFMRVSMRRMLEKHGYTVLEAENGLQGIQLYKENQPDIVTMDITMPEMSGIEALTQIKGLNPQAKVVMVTAMGQEGMVKQAVVNGATSFIVKPFKEEQFITTINKIVSA